MNAVAGLYLSLILALHLQVRRARRIYMLG